MEIFCLYHSRHCVSYSIPRRKQEKNEDGGRNSRKGGIQGGSSEERRERIMIERQTRYRARKMSARYSIDELARRSGAKRLDSSFAFSLDDDGDDASVWPV